MSIAPIPLSFADPHAHTDQDGEAKRRPLPMLSLTQWGVLFIAGATTVIAAVWWWGDIKYTGTFEAPAAWQTLVYTALTAWAIFLTRGLLEKIHRNQQAIMENQTKIMEYQQAAYLYHHDLGEKLDRWGDNREINGHRIAAQSVNGNGHRHLGLVDND